MAGKTSRTIAFVIAQCTFVMVAVVLAATSGAAAPKGNSGTVKIDGLTFSEHHGNEPHPSCDFRVTFWGFGEGRDATATFALQSPTRATTGSGTVSYGPIDIGTDPAGGGNDPDGSLEANLASFLENSGATAHPQQGFHVKLTVNAPGSQGADVKHKVFWVECATTVLGERTTRRPTSAAVLGTRTTRAGAGAGARTLATTGLSLGWMSLIAAELLLLGAAMVLASRRRKVGPFEIDSN